MAPYRGRNQASAFGRTIAQKSVTDALSVLVTGLFLVICSSFLVSWADRLPFETTLYECVSGFATVGLSLGVTPALSVFSKLVLVLLMFTGRVGVMTIGAAALFRSSGEGRIKEPEGRVMVG